MPKDPSRRLFAALIISTLLIACSSQSALTPNGAGVHGVSIDSRSLDGVHEPVMCYENCSTKPPTIPPTMRPTPIPTGPADHLQVTGVSFSDVSQGALTYKITVTYSNGKPTTAYSADGYNWEVPLQNGNTEAWNFEVIRNANNVATLIAQRENYSWPYAKQRRNQHTPGGSQEATCAVAGAVAGALGQTIGAIAGRSAGSAIGATVGSAFGPVGTATGIVVGYGYVGPAIGSTVGLAVGVWLGTYACYAFYPKATPPPLGKFNPKWDPYPNMQYPYDGGGDGGWGFEGQPPQAAPPVATCLQQAREPQDEMDDTNCP